MPVIPREWIEVYNRAMIVVEFSKIRPYATGEGDISICTVCEDAVFEEEISASEEMKRKQAAQCFHGCKYYCQYEEGPIVLPKKKTTMIKRSNQLSSL